MSLPSASSDLRIRAIRIRSLKLLQPRNNSFDRLLTSPPLDELQIPDSAFLKNIGLSPVEFLREMRIKKAAQLILADEGNMAQIAYQVGFNDSHYFSKCFKQVYGVTPTEYKSGKENRI